MKRVLLIAYQFPPVGGAGVQRAVKLVKYLPRFGWECSVLTVAQPSVPVFDNSLIEDIPDTTRIIAAKTWEPGYAAKQAVASQSYSESGFSWKQAARSLARSAANLVLHPDPQALWAPHAFRAAQRFLSENPHDAILATAPPFSSFVVGRRLAKAMNLPLLVDYRDEWSICNSHWENRSSSFVSRWIQRRQQNRVLREARAVIATTELSADALRAEVERAGSTASVDAIYNGFDPEDFEQQSVRAEKPMFRLAYVGTLWNLTNVEPFIRAVQQLCLLAPDLARRLEVVFAGRRTPAQDALVDHLKQLPCSLVRHDYLNHSEALKLLKSSDGLSIFLSDVGEAARVVPAKVFECIATENWMLVIAPNGELTRLVKPLAQASVHEPTDIDGISTSLATRLEMHRCGIETVPNLDPLEKFDRRCQARDLAGILNRIVDSRPCSAGKPADLVTSLEAGTVA